MASEPLKGRRRLNRKDSEPYRAESIEFYYPSSVTTSIPSATIVLYPWNFAEAVVSERRVYC